MARMSPPTIPTTASAAEQRLYHLLEKLPDDYRVFYGVRLRRRDPGSRFLDQRGEIDFAVLHPRFGLLLLEVKGGKLRRDGDAGTWYSEDAQGVEHEIVDPFVQVDHQAFLLRQFLAEGVTTRRFDYRVQTGVALTQTVVEGPIALHAPRHAVIDSKDIGDLEAALVRVYGEPLRHPLSKEALEAATDLLSPSVAFVKVGLNARFEEIERSRVEPTVSQRYLLDHFEYVPRAKVKGCAGSGKTLIAMEKARRLARAGLDVLFLCFNKQLALWAEAAMSDGSFAPNRVKVRHFHRLADEVCAAAGIPLFSEHGSPDWENVPARMEEALARAPMKLGAIVVDEGQDFRAEWWLVLMGELLERPDEDPFYVFYDSNQRIYTEELQLPADLLTYPLAHNLRNTRQIHEEVVRFYQGDPVPECAGPEGVEVARFPGPAVKGVQQALHELVHEQNVPTSDIVVLTGKGRERTDLPDGLKVGGVRLTWHPPMRGEVQVTTIHSFKGLERGVVVLAELDGYFPQRRELGEQLFYIGASRATRHLVLVGDALPPANA